MAKKKSKRIELGGPGSISGSTSGSTSGKESNSSPDGVGLTHSPFASLRGSLGASHIDAAAGASASGSEASADASPLAQSPWGGTVVVRHERKGHGGKTVTVADLRQADWASDHDLDLLAQSLRKALGVGARAGDQCITVQGNLVERVAEYFRTAYGANVTLGTR